MARDVLAKRLAGHLATRTSMINLRLARGLDELRVRKKPQSRERLDVLLRELYDRAPEAWDQRHRTDWRLRATRNAVLKKIEQRLPPREYKQVELTPLTESHARTPDETELAEEVELAAFAEFQAVLKRGKEAGLPPRERELFALVTGDPEHFLRNGKLDHGEAAREMGLANGTIKSLWSRIRKTLAT